MEASVAVQFFHTFTTDLQGDAADGAAWTSAIIASLQALTEAGATACLPPHICQGLLQLAHTSPTASTSCTATAAMPGEVAYGDINGSSGSKGSLVPPPLQQQENSQLQLWWAVATAACCGQLGLPSELGETMRNLLLDDSIADVAFELQTPQETVLAHQAIIAACCPKLFQAVQQQWQQQRKQQQKQQQLSFQQQPQQQGHDMSDGPTKLQLGKQVRAGTFKHVLEYLYTGQVQTLTSSEDRTALHKLAHALDLPQLAALAAASRPVAAARFAPVDLRGIAPCGPTSIPWDSFLSQEQCKQVQAQLQQQQQADSRVLDTEAIVEVTDAAETGSDEETVNCQLHPALGICTYTTHEVQLPVTIPAPAHAPPHVDLLLVPGTSCYGRSGCANKAQSGSHNEHLQAVSTIVDVDGNFQEQASTPNGHCSCCTTAATHQQDLQGLRAHRAILAASSPYFAAMLSDRWQAGTQTEKTKAQQHGSRRLLVARLPTQDMEVLFTFVHFCYTQELKLKISCHDGGEMCCQSRDVELCDRCWQARTAVRLSAAAEAWMVPALQELCLQYLVTAMCELPLGCQAALHADMVELQMWDFVQHLSAALP